MANKEKGDEEKTPDVEEKKTTPTKKVAGEEMQSAPQLIGVETLSDRKGLGIVNRKALIKKYGSLQHTEEEWMEILKNKISFK